MKSKNKPSENFKLGKSGSKMEPIFQVPDGYFEKLEGKITASLDSVLPDLHSSHPKIGLGLAIPSENYFDDLNQRIMDRIMEEEMLRDSNLHLPELKKVPFKVPPQYFEEFSSKIQEKILEEEPIFKDFEITNQLPFQVPTNYFGSLSNRIEEKVIPRQGLGAKLISLSRNQGIRNFSKLLVAASISSILIFIGIRIQHTNSNTKIFASSSQEDRLKYKYGVDESILEDEIIQDPSAELVNDSSQNPAPQNSINKVNDRYLLSHGDSNTLLEEL